MRRRRGFSLLELLVVITIISIVVALILPALAGVHEQARRTKCLAQLQQLGEAMQGYAGSSRDWLPVMPVPPGQPAISNQWRYGDLAGLFSLRQIGDGALGYGGGSPTGLPYSGGADEPLLAPYISSFAVLRCPSDRADRYYGDPYSPVGNMSYAAASTKTPQVPARAEDVVSYNMSYAYVSGIRLGRSGAGYAEFFLGDETNGPDLGDNAWYGYAQAPSGGSTANSTAAGAAAAGFYAPVDNHKAYGGNAITTGGGGLWSQRWWSGATTGNLSARYVID
jgi:prepilin-type N-terminal cleavage/methylation domain-containing protein